MGAKPTVWNGGLIPHDASLADLEALARSGSDATWPAIRVLAARSQPESLDLLVGLTESSDVYRRRAAAEAIGEHQLGAQAGEVIRHLLHDADGIVVRASCDAAAKLHISAAHDRLLQLTEAADENTRLAALRALGTLWRPSDFGRVFELYRLDRVKDVRSQAAWLLRDHAAPGTWSQVFEAFSGDPLARHRTYACEMAARFGSSAMLPGLKQLLVDSDGHVRKVAARAIQTITAGGRT